MIKIDKTDTLYKYLVGLGVDDVEKEYLTLAESGRYRRDDVIQFWSDYLRPSATEEVDEQELTKILDYFIDLKNIKKIGQTDLKPILKEYKENPTTELKNRIINSQLKDVLYICLNFSTLHKNIDVQDLVQIANLGLLEALDKYNVQARIDFKDYMIYYIRKTIMDEIGEEKNG